MLKLVKRPKSPFWIIRGSFAGRRIEETTGTSSRLEAEKLRLARERELIDRRVLGDAATLTFGAAAVAYIESATRSSRQESAVLALVDHFGERRPAASIDRTAIAGAALQIAGPGASPAKVNRWVLGPLSAVLKHSGIAIEIARAKEPEARVRWITEIEARRLLDACVLWQKHLRPLVTFLLFTGARTGEALALEWPAVNLQDQSVTFRAETTKARRTRVVPLPGPAFEALAGLRHRTGHVFRNREGYPYTRSESGNPIANPFRSICERAGIENFTPHDLRHTWATWHYQKNKDLIALQQLGGWASLDMVQKYAHVDAETHRSTAEKLGESWGSAENPKVVPFVKSAG